MLNRAVPLTPRFPSNPLIRWTPHPVIVTIRDNRDHIRVLFYSYYTTITGWGGAPPNPLIIRVPFFLLFSFNKETPKYKGHKGTTGVPRP